MASGSGGSFGEAFVNLLAAENGGQAGRYRSYTATGWHAQLSKLTSSDRGYQSASGEGISVTARTLKAWLAEDQEPNAENRRKIAEAYERMAGKWPAHIERQQFAIKGVVQMGRDVRDRGGADGGPLIIDGGAGHWDRMKAAWQHGVVEPDRFEEWFIEDVMEMDIGEGSEQWEFPGGAYTVST